MSYSNVVVGFIMMSDRGQIYNMPIAPEVQRRGLVKLVIEAISDKAQKCSHMSVFSNYCFKFL